MAEEVQVALDADGNVIEVTPEPTPEPTETESAAAVEEFDAAEAEDDNPDNLEPEDNVPDTSRGYLITGVHDIDNLIAPSADTPIEATVTLLETIQLDGVAIDTTLYNEAFEEANTVEQMAFVAGRELFAVQGTVDTLKEQIDDIKASIEAVNKAYVEKIQNRGAEEAEIEAYREKARQIVF